MVNGTENYPIFESVNIDNVEVLGLEDNSHSSDSRYT